MIERFIVSDWDSLAWNRTVYQVGTLQTKLMASEQHLFEVSGFEMVWCGRSVISLNIVSVFDLPCPFADLQIATGVKKIFMAY